ncbi:50S ribosomal protein L32e [Thermoproteota archaeon]
MKKVKTSNKSKQKHLTKPVIVTKVKNPKVSKLKTDTKVSTKTNKNKIFITKKKSFLSPSSSVEIKNLLELRKELRRTRPKFLRQESWRYVRVGPAWRRPKGTDSRMRLRRRGWPSLVKIGYGVPSKVRGLHPSGLKDILVYTMDDLERLNPEIDAVRLASKLGAKKRRIIVDRAHELGLKVLNVRGLRTITLKE